MVNGYKCFNKDLTSRYGDVFEIGKTYHSMGEIKFNKNGFHMCTNLEDTLRYFDAFNEEVDIANVVGYGKVDKYDDEYNEFFDMYATEYLIINHIMSHDEIINYALNLPPYRLKRFLSLYKLSKEELVMFRDRFSKEMMIMSTLDYYQDENSKLYIKKK